MSTAFIYVKQATSDRMQNECHAYDIFAIRPSWMLGLRSSGCGQVLVLSMGAPFAMVVVVVTDAVFETIPVLTSA